MQQICTKRELEFTRLVGEGDPQGTLREIWMGHANKWYMRNPKHIQKNETHTIYMGFDV